MGWQESIVGELNQHRLPLGMVVLLAVFGLSGWVHLNSGLDRRYVTTAESQQVQQKLNREFTAIRSDVDSTKQLLTQHLTDFNVTTVTSDLRTIDAQLTELQLHENQFGESSLTRSRRAELLDMKQAMTQYRNCLLAGGTTCQKPDL